MFNIGIDLEKGREGGTWLGMCNVNEEPKKEKIRIGALLNVTGEERHAGALGRGFIVTNYLKNPKINTENYIESLKLGQVYNAFNFVTVEVG